MQMARPTPVPGGGQMQPRGWKLPQDLSQHHHIYTVITFSVGKLCTTVGSPNIAYNVHVLTLARLSDSDKG